MSHTDREIISYIYVVSQYSEHYQNLFHQSCLYEFCYFHFFPSHKYCQVYDHYANVFVQTHSHESRTQDGIEFVE
jgi:hypothetical protein